jgi:hypothetical protein
LPSNVSQNLRREGRVEARVQVLVVRGRRTIPLETTDVSFKGLFLQTEEPPPVRSLVRLRVKLPHGDIEAHAMAVHVSGSGVGVQFWGLAGPQRLAWDSFIQELLQVKRSNARKSDPPPPSADNPTPSGIRIAPIVDLVPDASRDAG